MTMDEAVAGLKARRATWNDALAAYQAVGEHVVPKTHPARAAFRRADLDLNAYTSDNTVRPLLMQAMDAGIALR